MNEILKTVIIVVVIYLAYLFIWFILNLLAYFLSLIFKTQKILNVFVGLAAIIYYIFSVLLGIYIFVFTISLLFSGQILWFILMIIFGSSLIFGIIGFLQAPFIFIPAYFLQKLENINFKEDIIKGEVVDDKKHVIAISESDIAINRRIAVWFVIDYSLNFFSLIINRDEYPTYKWGDFISTPFLWIISQVLFFGLILGIYYKIKKGKFFYNNKKYFLGHVLKFGSIVFIFLTIIYFMLGTWRIQ